MNYQVDGLGPISRTVSSAARNSSEIGSGSGSFSSTRTVSRNPDAAALEKQPRRGHIGGASDPADTRAGLEGRRPVCLGQEVHGVLRSDQPRPAGRRCRGRSAAVPGSRWPGIFVQGLQGRVVHMCVGVHVAVAGLSNVDDRVGFKSQPRRIRLGGGCRPVGHGARCEPI